jgi:large subunit ribosomal protein L9
MRLVLLADVDGLGKRGDQVDVSDGYGRNFLLPHRRAIPASARITAQAQAMRRSRDLRDARDREGAETVARTLVPQVITIPARAGAGGKLFGSVTAQDVVDAVTSQTGVQLDRRKVHLSEPIKALGVHEVSVKLHAEVEFPVTVEVVAQS